MNYETAIEVLKRKSRAQNPPGSGFISLRPSDLEPIPEAAEITEFCSWLHESGYTRSFPDRAAEGERFIHLSPFALAEWDL